MSLIKKSTTLIDSTTDTNYIYIGKVIAVGDSTPETDKEIWEITRVTLVNGKATKIENGINKGNRAYLAWDQRSTYNYI